MTHCIDLLHLYHKPPQDLTRTLSLPVPYGGVPHDLATSYILSNEYDTTSYKVHVKRDDVMVISLYFGASSKM